MCKAIQDMQTEARKEGEQIGEERGKQIGELEKAMESARKMDEMGMPIEDIIHVVGYPMEEVKGWLA